MEKVPSSLVLADDDRSLSPSLVNAGQRRVLGDPGIHEHNVELPPSPFRFEQEGNRGGRQSRQRPALTMCLRRL